ncbi:hypothetical protein AAU61_04450 [Desulfocarbo indianensis]|nr:hypothetical protein AAU61_04450 [Desulfocarbo indianensis]
MRLQACQINAFANSSLYNLRINKPAKEPQEPVLASANEASAADQNSETSVRERFTAEMERRMAAAPVEDKQGEVKDYQPLLDSLTSTIDGLEERLGAEAANAAMAMVLQSTSQGFSDYSLGGGLCVVLEHVCAEYGSSQFSDVINEWDKDLKELFSEPGPEQNGRIYSISYAMAKYFDYEVEFSSSGMTARVKQFVSHSAVREDSGRIVVERGLRYVSHPDGSHSFISGACNFTTDKIREDLQPVIDFFRDQIKSDDAASYLENMSDEGVFEQGMARALSIVYGEQGMESLREAVGFLNSYLVDSINEKVAPYYQNGFGDRAVFSDVDISEPMPEYKKFSCEVEFNWKALREQDSYLESDSGYMYDMDKLYDEFLDSLNPKEGDTAVSTTAPPSKSDPGVLVNKTV